MQSSWGSEWTTVLGKSWKPIRAAASWPGIELAGLVQEHRPDIHESRNCRSQMLSICAAVVNTFLLDAFITRPCPNSTRHGHLYTVFWNFFKFSLQSSLSADNTVELTSGMDSCGYRCHELDKVCTISWSAHKLLGLLPCPGGAVQYLACRSLLKKTAKCSLCVLTAQGIPGKARKTLPSFFLH